MKRCIVILVAGVLAFVMQADATIINVPADYPTIQEAVNASVAGDTVLVQAGTYIENVNLYNKNILLASNFIFSNDPDEIDNTIIDGSSSGSVVTYESEFAQDSVFSIAGMTIENGSCGIEVSYGNPDLSNIRIRNTDTAVCGYVNDTLRINGSQTRITDNGDGINVVFYGYAEIDSCFIGYNSGSGIVIDPSDNWLWGLVSHCDFINNGDYGLRVSGEHDVPNIDVDDCLFEGNGTALWGGVSVSNSEIRNGENGLGGTYGPWSGQYFNASNCVFENLSGWVFKWPYNISVVSDCIVRNNSGEILTVSIPEEGLYIEFQNCQFIGNVNGITSPSSASGQFILSNCLHINNGGPVKGGGLNIAIENNTFALTDSNAIELSLYENINANINNNIISHNLGVGIYIVGDYSYISEISCNDVFCNDGGNYEGMPDITGIDGNISIDPRFCDPENSDYHLAENSPCAPDNNDCGELIGALPVNCDAITHTWHISVDGDDFSGNGSESNPFRTIQHGINMAIDGDTVLVWPGTYTGEGNRGISPMGKTLVIRGAFGADSTIIDVENHPYGFYFDYPPENSNTIVSGFTIKNADWGVWLTGSYNELQGLNISNCTTGLMCNVSSSAIIDCEFSNNLKGIDWQGFNFPLILRCFFIDNEIGVWRHTQGSCQGDQCPIDSCTFEGNTIAIQSCCMLSNSIIRGGEYGIYVPWPMDAIISNCILENIYGIALNARGLGDKWNTPDSIRERISTECYGPGFAVFNSIIRNNPGQIARVGANFREDWRTLILDNCQIYGNGGGISGWGQLTIINCDYSANALGIEFEQAYPINISGSAFRNNDNDALNIFAYPVNVSGVNIQKSIFANNRGHGMYIDVGYNEEFIINGCTFAQNDEGGITVQGFYNSDSLKIDDSIITDNGGFGLEVLDSPECILVSYCDNYGNSSGNYFGIPDQTGLNGNISEDPLFIDPENNNYRLQCASPCVDTGNPDILDPDGTRSDMGAFYLPHYYSPTETGIIAPPNGSVADSLTWLTWLESTDEDTSCNIVFYRLQIDEDPNFESPEVNIDALPASGLLLEETISYRILSLPGWLNLLDDSTYFWRVGSVDEIGDTSAWTPGPNHFIFVIPAQIPTLSEWGMIILALLLLTAGTVSVIRRRQAATTMWQPHRQI